MAVDRASIVKVVATRIFIRPKWYLEEGAPVQGWTEAKLSSLTWIFISVRLCPAH